MDVTIPYEYAPQDTTHITAAVIAFCGYVDDTTPEYLTAGELLHAASELFAAAYTIMRIERERDLMTNFSVARHNHPA